MGRQTVTLQAKYKKGAKMISDRALPDLNHLNEGFYCSQAEITSMGRILIDGKEFEFVDMRCIIKERGQ
jgi:hypothetical protein